MDLDAQALAFATSVRGGLQTLRQRGISEQHLTSDWRPIWRFVTASYDRYGKIPSRGSVESRWVWATLPVMKPRDIDSLCEGLVERRSYTELMRGLEHILRNIDSYSEVSRWLPDLRRVLDRAAAVQSNGHVQDPFSKEGIKTMIEEIRFQRKAGRITTGLPCLDRATGGLRPRRLIVVAGRPATGKTQFAIRAMAHAAYQDRKVLFYSLEMSPEEVYGRLYAITSRERLGPAEALRAMDLSTGQVRKMHFLRAARGLAPIFKGKFLVSDSSVSCTIDQVQTDVERYDPDMVWIDYLTLMPRGHKDGWMAIQDLTRGLKRIAIDYEIVVGCCAQLNRESKATKKTKPGIEHLYMGDSAGQDADLVVALIDDNDDGIGEGHAYSLIKNRHGPTTPWIPMRFLPDKGIMEEEEA